MFKPIRLTRIRFSLLTIIGMLFLVLTQTVWSSTSNDSSELQFELIGREFYNRPLFGSEAPFVTFGGDLPAFAISGGWYGGKLGNLHLVIMMRDESFTAYDAKYVKAFYDGLSLSYEIRDPRLKDGVLHLDVFPRRPKGFLAHLVAEDLPAGTTVTWVYGGASGQYDYKYPANYGSKTPILPLLIQHRKGNIITTTDDGFILSGIGRKDNGRCRLWVLQLIPGFYSGNASL